MLWPIVLRFSLPMPFGIGLGLWLFHELPQKWVQVFIGGFILLSLSSHSLKSFQEKELKLWMFIVFSFELFG